MLSAYTNKRNQKHSHASVGTNTPPTQSLLWETTLGNGRDEARPILPPVSVTFSDPSSSSSSSSPCEISQGADEFDTRNPGDKGTQDEQRTIRGSAWACVCVCVLHFRETFSCKRRGRYNFPSPSSAATRLSVMLARHHASSIRRLRAQGRALRKKFALAPSNSFLQTACP